jgi:hypothetical protein
MSGNLSFVFLKENHSHCFIFFQILEDVCTTDIYQQMFSSGWDFFEEPNLRGTTIDCIEIYRGEFLGI